jgi:MFS family permease
VSVADHSSKSRISVPVALPGEGMEHVPPHIKRTLWMSIWEGCATTVFINWTSGAVLTGYMLAIGGTPSHVALVGSVPMLAQCANPIAGWLQQFVKTKKTFLVWVTSFGRSLWLIAALLPILNLPAEHLPGYLLLVLFLSSILQSCGGVFWQGMMGDVVPRDRRGRYFGLRNGICSVVALTASFVAGRFLDYTEAPWNYQFIILMAVIFAGIGIYLYTTHYEPPWEPHRVTLREAVVIPFRDKNFRNFLRFALYWQASVQLGAVLVFPYFLSHLGMTYTEIAIWFAIASSMTLLFGPMWGRIADRFGNKPVLAINTFLAGAVLPTCWILATPDNHWPIYISGVVDALVWSAINAAIFNLGLATAPENKRMVFMGVLGMCFGFSGFVGGVAAAYLYDVLLVAEFTVAGFEWTAFHWLFFASGIMRAFGFLLIRSVQETHAWRTREAMRVMTRFLFYGFQWR